MAPIPPARKSATSTGPCGSCQRVGAQTPRRARGPRRSLRRRPNACRQMRMSSGSAVRAPRSARRRGRCLRTRARRTRACRAGRRRGEVQHPAGNGQPAGDTEDARRHAPSPRHHGRADPQQLEPPPLSLSPLAPSAWTGGHGTEPYEQNTQQSPARGRSSAWQPAHSWKNRQASVGIASVSVWPQAGQVRTEVSFIVLRPGCSPAGRLAAAGPLKLALRPPRA